MTQPLTQQQIAEMKANLHRHNHYAHDFDCNNGNVLSLIATLEARDAAFDAMLEALKLADDLVFAPMRNRKLVMDEHRHTVDEAIRSAIAHAENVASAERKSNALSLRRMP